MGKRILFTSGWMFHDGEIQTLPPALKGPVYTQAKTEAYRNGPASVNYDDRHNDFGSRPGHMLTHERWIPVDLPHDYIVNSPIDPDGNQALGFYKYRPAWYRKHFKPDESWAGKRIELELLGVATECDIYFNGSYMKSSRTAYTPIILDISDFIRYGQDNVIAIHVKQRTIENWWYNGGGITHKVYLKITDKLSVDTYGVFVNPKKISDSEWQTYLSVDVRNGYLVDADAMVTVDIIDPEGREIAKASTGVTVEALGKATAKASVKISSPLIWDIDSPNLYKARTRVEYCAQIVDEQYDNFGYRTIEFTPNDGFYLNGRRVNINGVCGHEDFSLTGKAVPDNVMRHKVRLLRDMGANAYRCAHSMQDEEMMNAFDKYGMLVMAETRHFSSTDEHIGELRDLVKRDRNHPSVFMWSVGNEEHYFITDEGRRIAERMTFEVKRLDPSRPVMTANDKSPEQCTVYETSDLVAVNYNPSLYDYLHEKYPEKPFFVSECSAAGGTRGWYRGDLAEGGRRCVYDKNVNNWFQSHETVYSEIGKRPWIMGAFLWSAIEYLGEAVWPRICSVSGLIDLYLQKKDSYYQMRSFYIDEPMVHILPHWNMDGMGEVKVFAYTNCDSVELFLNGNSIGRQKCNRFIHNEWIVDFEPGELICIGYAKDGKEACRDVKHTTGPAAQLRLRVENEGDYSFNGEDLVLVTCYAVDSDGREVPDAEGVVTFSSDDGVKIIGTGSDNTDHIPPSSPVRRMYMGRVLCALLPVRDGEMTVTATAPGLKGVKIKIDVPKDKEPVEGRIYPKYVIKG